MSRWKKLLVQIAESKLSDAALGMKASAVGEAIGSGVNSLHSAGSIAQPILGALAATLAVSAKRKLLSLYKPN